MIKSVAKLFEFNPESISKKKLRQILVMMLLSLPVWPLLMMDQYGMLPDSWVSILAVIVLIVGAISMFCFVCTRFVNRFYFPDKYLDEWEKAIKHRSMSFAFMVFAWVAAPLFLLFTGVGDFKFSMTGEELGLWFVGLLLSFLYLQTFHALWQVEPIDEDELGEPVVKSRKGLFIFAGTMMVFVGGMIILGYMTAHNDSTKLCLTV